MGIWGKVSNAFGDWKVKNGIKSLDKQVTELVNGIELDNINERSQLEDHLNNLILENSSGSLTEEEAAVAVIWGVSRYVEDKGTKILRRVESGMDNTNESKAADKLKRLDITSKALLDLSEKYKVTSLGEQHRPEVIMFSLALLDRNIGEYSTGNNSKNEKRRKEVAKEYLQAKRDQNQDEMDKARKDIESELQDEMSSSLDYLNNLRQEAESALSSAQLN